VSLRYSSRFQSPVYWVVTASLAILLIFGVPLFTSFVFAHHLPLKPSLLIGAGALVILALIGGKQIVRRVYEDEPKK
jgi:uncharacterized membrane protein YfcA